MDVSEEEVGHVFYVSLLLHMGCIAFSHETAALFGDDLAVNRAAIRANLTEVRQVFTVLIPEMTRGMQAGNRPRSAVTMTVKGRSFGMAHDLASCEVARAVARRLGLPEPVSAGLYDVHEWWNGRGRGVYGLRRSPNPPAWRGSRPRLPSWPASVAATRWLGDSAAAPVRPWIPGSWTPSPPMRDTLLEEIAFGDPRTRILEIEPDPVAAVQEPDIARIAAAFGDLVDLKTPFTHGHSGGVADLAVAAAERLRLDPLRVGQLRVAALLHDVGRAGVSNAVWEKPGPLATAEWEQARLHAYLSERVLATSAALAPMATIAGMHHERLDGSGYHRGRRVPSSRLQPGYWLRPTPSRP